MVTSPKPAIACSLLACAVLGFVSLMHVDSVAQPQPVGVLEQRQELAIRDAFCSAISGEFNNVRNMVTAGTPDADILKSITDTRKVLVKTKNLMLTGYDKPEPKPPAPEPKK